MSQTRIADVSDGTETTTVTVRCTGHVRSEVGESSLTYRFEGTTLREFLAAFFEDYDVEEMLIAMDEESEAAPGWAPAPKALPGTWKNNPKGERSNCFARVLVNGTFNEHLDGFDTTLEDSDRVSLLYPFVFCV
ncbi:MAG: pterin cluster protein [Halodesulfurarchaeum sp.]